jgi:hypothetical protein
MTVDRTPAMASVIDVLDRALDKGIVIDAWARVSLAGIDLVTVEARVIVASIGTYLAHSSAVSTTELAARPALATSCQQSSLAQELYRVADRLEHDRMTSSDHRRAEDRIRDDLHDQRVITVIKGHVLA